MVIIKQKFLTCIFHTSDLKKITIKLKIDGEGIKITAPTYFGFSAHNQYNSDFDAGKKKQQRHTTDIKKRDFVNINIDRQQMGVGGDNSWGAMPHKEYRIQSKEMSYRYTISKFSNEYKSYSTLFASALSL